MNEKGTNTPATNPHDELMLIDNVDNIPDSVLEEFEGGDDEDGE